MPASIRPKLHNPRNLLVTGGAGFIGSNFVRYWMQKFPQSRLVVVDALTYAGQLGNLRGLSEYPGFRFVHADIRDGEQIEALLVEEKIDTLINFAAETHVDRSILNPDIFVETNILGVHSLLKAVKRVWLERPGLENHRFHQVSTDEIYGPLSPDAQPATEIQGFKSSSPYAASKASADQLVWSYHRTYGLNTSISFCGNNYGPFQYPEKLIPVVIISCIRKTKIPVYGDGRQIRDWINVQDHVCMLDRIIHSAKPGTAYNISSECERCNLDMVTEICRIMDRMHPGQRSYQGLIAHVRDRPGHDRRYALDASQFRKELGDTEFTELSQGLEATVKWYLEHRDWWQPLLVNSGGFGFDL